MYRPCHCLEVSCGTLEFAAICFFLWSVLCECSLRSQTTRIKGIMPKGLEVELELLGVKGM